MRNAAYTTLQGHVGDIVAAVRAAPQGGAVEVEAGSDGTWRGAQVVTQDERNDPDRHPYVDGLLLVWDADPAADPEAVVARIHKVEADMRAARESEAVGRHGIGAALAHLRHERGLSQRDVAAATGLAQPAIVRIERGSHSPTVATLQVLAAALDAVVEVRADQVQVWPTRASSPKVGAPSGPPR